MLLVLHTWCAAHVNARSTSMDCNCFQCIIHQHGPAWRQSIKNPIVYSKPSEAINAIRYGMLSWNMMCDDLTVIDNIHNGLKQHEWRHWKSAPWGSLSPFCVNGAIVQALQYLEKNSALKFVIGTLSCTRALPVQCCDAQDNILAQETFMLADYR